ncbi:MAG: VWA-like domain-containing protein [Gammaproteobacteria bacterium]|nr:VWA-like domain-containing protein [Gammaproteobacteria bacterium]
MAAKDDVETKLAAARTRLILDKPFLGSLVLRLPLVAADPAWCDTTATDARAFYYNRDYIGVLSLEQTQFVLAHEALHCALSHFVRRQHRVRRRWDLACDYAVNPMLVADGLTPPPGVLLLDSFEGMTAEEIYPCIQENDNQEPLDQHLYDESDSRDDGSGGSQHDQDRGERQPEGSQPGNRDSGAASEGRHAGAAMPAPLTEGEREAMSVQWRQRLAGAAQQAMQAGKLTASMARMVDQLLQPRLPWRMMLARYMSASARDDYSFMRPSRREGAAILPSLRSTQVELAIVLDTSGSIGDKEMHEFLAEVNALKGQLRARVTLLGCDDKLSEDGPWRYEPWEELTLPESLSGGGGTSFIPPFAWLKAQDRQPDLVLYFTDAEGEFPRDVPVFPVIWLVKGKAPVPWGQRVQLN